LGKVFLSLVLYCIKINRKGDFAGRGSAFYFPDCSTEGLFFFLFPLYLFFMYY
jgi:hypothetical protein